MIEKDWLLASWSFATTKKKDWILTVNCKVSKKQQCMLLKVYHHVWPSKGRKIESFEFINAINIPVITQTVMVLFEILICF